MSESVHVRLKKKKKSPGSDSRTAGDTSVCHLLKCQVYSIAFKSLFQPRMWGGGQEMLSASRGFWSFIVQWMRTLNCVVATTSQLLKPASQFGVNNTRVGVWRKHNQLDENKMSRLVFHCLSGSGSWGVAVLAGRPRHSSPSPLSPALRRTPKAFGHQRCNLSNLS